MLFRRIGREILAVAIVSFAGIGCSGSHPCTSGPGAEALYVAHDGVLVSYDIACGTERPGTVTNVLSPTDMQALEDGTVLVNLTAANATDIVDGQSMLERGRVSSPMGGTRPVHSYISPERAGKRYWLALYDGQGSDLATSRARFIDIEAGSPSYLQGAGEVGLGIGHHKAAFSNTQQRVIVSNISDCGNVFSAYDYTNIGSVQRLKTWAATDLGWNTPAKTCNPNTNPMSPHGCATSKLSGEVYCNITASGEIAVMKIDASPPQLQTIIQTQGSGSGYTRAYPGGRFLYSLQEKPREGFGGATCQVGQLAVIDVSTDTLATTVPLLYKGPGCNTPNAGTDEASVEPDHIRVSADAKTLYISIAGAFGDNNSHARQELVVDVTNPAAPVQKASIPVGLSTGHHGDALSGDGKWLFVTNNLDGTVTQVDTSSNRVTRTLTVRSTPLTLATFGTAEGPSDQTGPIR